MRDAILVIFSPSQKKNQSDFLLLLLSFSPPDISSMLGRYNVDRLT